MKIGIIHLSDIHIKSENDRIISKSKLIVNSIQNQINSLDKLIILITGDIAFSGLESQYYTAYCFLDEIKSSIENKQKIKVDILTCPGNHDCIFEEDSVREMVIENVLKNGKVDEKIINACCCVQKEYFKFKDFINDSTDDSVYLDNLIEIKEYKLDNEKVYFIGLNTSWLSHKYEIPSKIYFPISYYNEIIKRCNDGLVISYFHHPSSWCHPDQTNYLDDKIETISDFIFLGHEHDGKEFMKKYKNNEVIYIKGGPLQESEDDDKSTFNFLIIDSDIKSYKNVTYNFNEDIYYPNDNVGWIPYMDMIKSRGKKYSLHNEHISFLTDVGINLNHPRKDKLLLQDIYVYPDLEIININKKDNDIKQKIYKNSSKINIIEDKANYFLIVGDDKHGKTSLAKQLFLDFFKQDLYPIYISGLYINNNLCNNIEKLIINHFSEQYDGNKEEHFSQLDNKKKVIIIDDIDKSPISHKLKYNFIDNLSSVYPNIILFANTLFDFQELINTDNKMIVNTMFEQYIIRDFGHKLKDKLIHKWNLVGQEDIYTDEDLVFKDEQILKNVNIIIGNDYIPSIPFYLLIIMQSLETGNNHKLVDSAYGHYYEFLILETLNKISNIQGDIDAFKNFITMLSKKFYYKSINRISECELKLFHTEFCNKYRISKTFKRFINFETLINDLCEANILKYSYGMYEYSYKYIYYYCIGKYFSEHISNKDITNELSELISKLYIEENANIVLFIIHHTKNEFILNELLNKSNEIFNENEYVKLESDITFVNDLQCELPKLTIGEIDIFKEREKKLERLDQKNIAEEEIASSMQNNIEENAEEIEEDEKEVLNKINKLNLSFKLMEILGQLLKNHWGSLDGNIRKDIGKELYLLGFRSLREIYNVFKDAKENLALIINKNLEDKNITDKEDREKETKNMLFMFIGFFTNSYIYKIASCVGDDKLSETFYDIELELNCNSAKLVNLAIKLEYFNSGFPYPEVEQLIKFNKKNILPQFLVSHMVHKYLYIHKTSLSDRNRIANLINVSMKNVNINEAKLISEKTN